MQRCTILSTIGLQVALPLLYGQRGGLHPPSAQVPATARIIPSLAYLITSDIATDILQLMLKHDNIVAQLQATAATEAQNDEAAEEQGADDGGGAGAGMSAAETSTMAAAAAYNDSFAVGESVFILVDHFDGRDDLDSPAPIASGIIRGTSQFGTDECAFFEVN